MPRYLILLLFAATLLAGCGHRAVRTAKTAPESQVTAPVPASSWDAFLQTLGPEQRRELTAINARHFGALRFQNEAERRKLDDLGFPTPEDVLEAAKLTDSELKARANSGDVQAQMLLVDRLTSRAEALYAARDTKREAYEAASARAFVELAIFSARHKQSPFGPYLDGRLHWKLMSNQPAEVMAASLMVASNMGDWRARTWLTQFQRQNPQLDAAKTVVIYDTLRRGWRMP